MGDSQPAASIVFCIFTCAFCAFCVWCICWLAGQPGWQPGWLLPYFPALFLTSLNCSIDFSAFFLAFSAFSAFSAFLEDPGQLGCAEGPGVAFLHLCQCFSAFFVQISLGFLHFLHFLHFLEDPGQAGCS